MQLQFSLDSIWAQLESGHNSGSNLRMGVVWEHPGLLCVTLHSAPASGLGMEMILE